METAGPPLRCPGRGSPTARNEPRPWDHGDLPPRPDAGCGHRRATSLVDPFDGTGIGLTNPGNVSEYPGASAPLGMVQFSPDTSPDRGVTTGSGYDYGDTDISGFSLTHLSGDGCAIYGDIPILPVVGSVPASPDTAIQPFSHADERASAGNYTVSLGGGGPTSRSGSDSLRPHGMRWAPSPSRHRPAVAPRTPTTSCSRSVIPPTVRPPRRSAWSAPTSSAARSPVEISAASRATTRCTSPPVLPEFRCWGDMENDVVGSEASCASATSAGCGAWVRFPSKNAGSQKVLVKVGVSFVSAAGPPPIFMLRTRGGDFQQTSPRRDAGVERRLSRVRSRVGHEPISPRLLYGVVPLLAVPLCLQ